jgi:hypothetical protein
MDQILLASQEPVNGIGDISCDLEHPEFNA